MAAWLTNSRPPEPLSVQDLCLEIERTVALLVRLVGGRALAHAQDEPLMQFGVQRQVQILCAAVEQLAQIDVGIAERNYGKLIALRTVQRRGFANLNECLGFDQRLWNFVENRLPLLRRGIEAISASHGLPSQARVDVGS
ncbi:MAG TPA: hypothetical protein VII35_00975 [Steroidobacteraceae bacterium]